MSERFAVIRGHALAIAQDYLHGRCPALVASSTARSLLAELESRGALDTAILLHGVVRATQTEDRLMFDRWLKFIDGMCRELGCGEIGGGV